VKKRVSEDYCGVPLLRAFEEAIRTYDVRDVLGTLSDALCVEAHMRPDDEVLPEDRTERIRFWHEYDTTCRAFRLMTRLLRKLDKDHEGRIPEEYDNRKISKSSGG